MGYLNRVRLWIGIGLLLVLACQPAEEPAPVVYLVHLTDTHVMNLEDYHPALVERRQHYSSSHLALQNFFRTVPRQVGADAVIVTGDLIDFYEGETITGELQNRQIEFFSRLSDRCPVPLLLTLGNHDITTSWSGLEEGKRATQYQAQKARAVWIRTLPCFSEGTYYSRTYQVGRTSYRLIFLDNGYRVADSPLSGLWDRPQLDWLQDQLRSDTDEVVLLFYHIPLPVSDTNQDSIHFKLPPEGWVANEIAGDGILRVLNDSPAIVAAFTGHGHNNIVEDMPLEDDHTFTQVETGAFARDAANWRFIQLREREVIISAPGGSEVDKRIPIDQ